MRDPWYTELESTAQTNNPLGGTPATYNSFTGYWGLEVAGMDATLFHRLSNASLDNLTNGNGERFREPVITPGRPGR